MKFPCLHYIEHARALTLVWSFWKQPFSWQDQDTLKSLMSQLQTDPDAYWKERSGLAWNWHHPNINNSALGHTYSRRWFDRRRSYCHCVNQRVVTFSVRRHIGAFHWFSKCLASGECQQKDPAIMCCWKPMGSTKNDHSIADIYVHVFGCLFGPIFGIVSFLKTS